MKLSYKIPDINIYQLWEYYRTIYISNDITIYIWTWSRSRSIGCRFRPFMQPQLQPEHLRVMESCNSMTIHPGPRHPGPWHKTSWPGLVSRVGSSLPPPLSILVASNPARNQVPPEISDVVTKGSAAAAWLWPSLPPNSASLEWIQQLFPKFGKSWSWCKRVGSILRSVSLHNSRTNFLV